jgi:hypothetical protein
MTGMRMPTLPKPGGVDLSPIKNPALAGLTKHLPAKASKTLQRASILKHLGGMK